MDSIRSAEDVPLFILAAALSMEASKGPGSPDPPRGGLRELGSTVHSTMEGRASGVIVGFNTNPGPIYGADDYPYVVLWEDGYRDVYGEASFSHPES